MIAGNNRIVIIGGGACGPKTAARSRRLDSTASITIIQNEPFISYAACGLPYLVSGTVSNSEKLLARTPEAFKEYTNIKVLTATSAEKIDRANHSVEVLNRQTGEKHSIIYDKLVIATGANPVVPPLPGIELKGIHLLKRIPDAEAIIQLTKTVKNKKALIVGAGSVTCNVQDFPKMVQTGVLASIKA